MLKNRISLFRKVPPALAKMMGIALGAAILMTSTAAPARIEKAKQRPWKQGAAIGW